MTIDTNRSGRTALRFASASRETLAFGILLASLVLGFFHESLFRGKILSPADVLLVEASFESPEGADYEPANRLLMDPVLQFQPWLELNRSEIRKGRLPLWNPYVGCGAPHLANGQSAVFDPFNVIAYVWTVADALGWMAAARLWTAGMGMFLLARAWNLGLWGRWFAGLVFPFSGFLVGWLLYPVTPVAIWMPWLFLASQRALERKTARSIIPVALATAMLIFGGHIQTAAHVLLAVGLFVVYRTIGVRRDAETAACVRGVAIWGVGIVLGLALASIQILPLADYLSKSPVWEDRQRETPPWWKPAKPRILDVLCTPLPYAYGSQRRGHPNLARGLGVHNLNESAGGFTGLPTLALLVPLAWKGMRRSSRSEADEPNVLPFLFGLAMVGFLGAYRLPPVDNLLRLLPVLNVTDNRRLGLWMAFAFALLGGSGLDAFRNGFSPGRRWTWLLRLCAVALLLCATVILASRSTLQKRAEAHYREASERSDKADPGVYLRRAERQVRATVGFLPGYYAISATGLLILVGVVGLARRRPDLSPHFALTILALTLVDLARFGLGLNPAIDRAIQDYVPPVIESLRRELKPGERILGVGEEVPPNVAMRFGLSDPRNYDSIELSGNLDWMAPLYDDGRPRTGASTSRRDVTWRGVANARGRLEKAGVRAVIGSSPPPEGVFEKAEKRGEIWITWLDAKPWAALKSGRDVARFTRDPGRIRIDVEASGADEVVVLEAPDEGWDATIDGSRSDLHIYQGKFLIIHIPSGIHSIILEYHPECVTVGAAISAIAAASLLGILGLTRIAGYLIPGYRSSKAWTEPSQGIRI